MRVNRGEHKEKHTCINQGKRPLQYLHAPGLSVLVLHQIIPDIPAQFILPALEITVNLMIAVSVFSPKQPSQNSIHEKASN